jgi:hypothetical protein
MKDGGFVIVLLATVCWIILLLLILLGSKVFGFGITWRNKKLWVAVIAFALMGLATYPCENWRCIITVHPDVDYSPKSFSDHLTKAEQGDWTAQRWLGRNYQLGNRVEQNLTEAYFWLSLACYYEYLTANVTSQPNSVGDRQTKKEMLEDKIGKCLLQPLPTDSKVSDIVAQLTSEQRDIVHKRVRHWIAGHQSRNKTKGSE